MRRAALRRGAFTLVELLVVIGIIALLISILIPTLSRARQQGIGVKCAANMRSVGQQIMIYSNNYKGWLYPPQANGDYRGSGLADEKERWIPLVFDEMMRSGTLNATNHYSPEVMHCPADDVQIVDGGNADPFGSYHSYNYNMGLFPQFVLAKWLRYGQSVPRLTYSDVCLMVEKQQTMHDWHMNVRKNLAVDTRQQWYQPLFGQTVTGSFDPDVNDPKNPKKYKHGRYGNNYLFLDWSVRNDEPKMYQKAPIGTNGNEGQWAPHDYYWELPGHSY